LNGVYKSKTSTDNSVSFYLSLLELRKPFFKCMWPCSVYLKTSFICVAKTL